MSISATLQKAAKLQEKIEDLRQQLSDLLNKARQELASSPAPVVPATLSRVAKSKAPVAKAAAKPAPPAPKKGKGPVKKVVAEAPKAPAPAPVPKPVKSAKAKSRGSRSSLAGRKRAASPSGPLAPAVVKVLEANGKPMRVAEILDGLFSDGYTFSSPEPKKNLAARIYRLSGVKQVAEGLFTTV